MITIKFYYCKTTDTVPQLKALERRLPLTHATSKTVKTSLIRELAGLKGQKALHYPLQISTYPSPPTIIFNPRLKDLNGFFEIDVLVMTAHYILLLEVKNWYGTLYIDGERQIVRVGDNGVEEGMTNPFSQAKVQAHRLRCWLDSHTNLPPDIPIHPLVVISFPTTILKPMLPGSNIPSSLIHANQLPFRIDTLNRTHSKEQITPEEIALAGNTIFGNHCASTVNMIERLDVAQQDLTAGVLCPNCCDQMMTRMRGCWVCRNCRLKSAVAHLDALREYQLLAGREITSLQAARYLGTTRFTARRLLEEHCQTVRLESGRKYYTLDFL